jgi:hypothetical protein
MRQFFIAFLFAAVALAGCADNSEPANADDGFSSELDDELQATDTTGIIRGLIVDAAIVPVADANIELIGQEKTTRSNEDGQFGFAELDPGAYFVKVTKLGYAEVRQSIQVEAGVDKPALSRILMEVDIEGMPFTELQMFRGYLQCGAGLGAAGSVNACVLVDSINVFDVPTQADLTTTQLEMVWAGTNVFGDGLDLGLYNPNTLASNFVSTDGPSPQILTVAGSAIEEKYGEDMASYTFRIFPGNDGDVGVTAIIEQKVDIFVTHFHGFEPTEGWAFINDGEHPLPS